MRKLFHPYIVLLAAVVLAGCSVKEVLVPEESGALELKGVRPVIVEGTGTKAGTVTPLADYVGRSEFVGGDQVVFTRICRTDEPLGTFTYPGENATYQGIVFQAGAEGGWQRISDGGPERIYWTDAASEHTFIAYGVPQDASSPGYDWKSFKYTTSESAKTYYIGSLGNPLLTGEDDIIDYSLTPEEQETNKKTINNVLVYFNPKLEKEDLVIAYSEEMKAEPGGSVALVQFYHALSSVRVVVNISGFSSSSTAADNEAVVSNMFLLHQPTMYAWEQSGYGAQPLREADQVVIDGAWGAGEKPAYNQRKDLKLWIPRPAGAGDKQSKTFTFYGITTPQPSNYISTLAEDDVHRYAELSFDVTYPNPLMPSQMVTHTYKASLKDVYFDAAYSTTINISLNHKNEKMTIGAEYENWQFVATPDVSELFKNSTFLQDTDRYVPGTDNVPNVTIVTDEQATADDATWLYQSGENVLDIYGHNGSSVEDAYQISTAYQFLSFAYEVKSGNTFEGKYVRLDADLTLQASSEKTQVEIPSDDESYPDAPSAISWIGIGESGKPFNGTFLGGDRYIYSLYGSPLFAQLGPKAKIVKLQVSAVQPADNSASVTGDGLLAQSNAGLLSACKVDGNVTLSGETTGAFVGTNTGTVYACYHIGNTGGSGTTGGLVGSNSGTVRNSYQVGKVTGTTTGGVAGSNSGTLTTTYFNSTLTSPTASFEGATGKSTLEMTMPGFVTALNIGIGEFAGTAPDNLWSFVLRPADYPKIGDYVPLNGWLETDLPLIGASERFVIVGNNGSNYAMANDNGDSQSPDATLVTVKDGAVTGDVPSNLQWTLTTPAGGYAFHPFGYAGASLYVSDLGANNRNVNVREAEDDRNVFTVEDGFLKNTASSRFLGIYDSAEWRSYLSHTNKTDNINNQVFKFYKFYADDKNAAFTLAHAGKVHVGDASFNLVIANPNNVTYTLTSGDESIANVTHEGAVTVNKAGKVTLTAAWEEQNGFREGRYSYILKVWPATATITFNNPQTWLTVGHSVTNAATVTPDGISVTYSSSDESVATVNAATGEVTGVAPGMAEITATVSDGNYTSVSDKYTLSVVENMAVTLTQPTGGGSFTASAGGNAINSGAELAASDVVTLAATPANGYNFLSWRVFRTDNPTVMVDVTDNQFSMPPYGVTVTATFVPSGSALYYVKVTSDSELTDGDYLIVHEGSGNVLTGVNNNNIGTYAGVTITDSRIAYSAASAYNVAIGKNGSQYRMKQNGKYLAYTSTSTSDNNNLFAVTDPYTNGTLWTLSIAYGAQNVYNTSRKLQWNSDRFCCYTSNQSKITFYKLQEGEPQDTTPRTITVTTPSHGTVATNPSGPTTVGTLVTITATPEEGYLTSCVSVNSAAVSVTPGASDTYTFIMPASDVTVAAEFITLNGYTSKVLTFSGKYSVNTLLNGVSVEEDGITASFATNGGSTVPQYYTSGAAVRWYGSNSMTVSAGGNTIQAIIITYSQKDKTVTANVGTYNHGNGLWTGSATSVTFTVESGGGHNRITSVTVYY